MIYELVVSLWLAGMSLSDAPARTTVQGNYRSETQCRVDADKIQTTTAPLPSLGTVRARCRLAEWGNYRTTPGKRVVKPDPDREELLRWRKLAKQYGNAFSEHQDISVMLFTLELSAKGRPGGLPVSAIKERVDIIREFRGCGHEYERY